MSKVSKTADLCSTFLGAKRRSLPLTISPIPSQGFLLTLSIFTVHLPQHYLSHAAFFSELVKYKRKKKKVALISSLRGKCYL